MQLLKLRSCFCLEETAGIEATFFACLEEEVTVEDVLLRPWLLSCRSPLLLDEVFRKPFKRAPFFEITLQDCTVPLGDVLMDGCRQRQCLALGDALSKIDELRILGNEACFGLELGHSKLQEVPACT